MIQQLKSILRSTDKKQLDLAENDFDRLMDMLNQDELDMDQIKRHVKEEFDEIDGDIQQITEKVDELMKNKKSNKSK